MFPLRSLRPFARFVGQQSRRFVTSDLGQLTLTVAVSLALVHQLRGLFWKQAVLDHAQYAKPWLVGVLAHRPTAIFLLAIPTYVLIATKTLATWTDIENGRALRRFVLVVLGVLVWSASTHGYNFYLDQSHVWDRLLLIGLFALCWKTPLAVPWAVFLTLTLKKHNDVPFRIDQTDWRALMELLIVFCAYLWSTVGRRARAQHFLVLALTHVGAFYLVPGLTKFRHSPRWSWMLENKVSNMTHAAHLHGWLGFLSPESMARLISAIEPLTVALQAGTLAIEIGAILLFVHRRVAMVLLLGLALLHVGIFSLCGIFFWKWIVTDIALLLFIRELPLASIRKYFLPGVIIPIVATLVMWHAPKGVYRPPTLTWFSGKTARVYELEVEGVSGRMYRLDPNYLAPFEVYFHQGAHGFLDGVKHLDGIYGGMSHKAALALEGAEDVAGARAILRKYGKKQRNEGTAKSFEKLLTTYFQNLNRRGSKFYWLAALGPPHHLQNQLPGELYDTQEPVVKVHIFLRKTFFDGERIHTLQKRRRVRTIWVPRDP